MAGLWTNVNLKERRTNNRRKLTGLLPGKMARIDGRALSCRPVDVSRNGLGILSTDLLKAGDEIILTMKERSIALEVVWEQPDFGKMDLNRYGLVTSDASDNLEEIFVASGCLR